MKKGRGQIRYMMRSHPLPVDGAVRGGSLADALDDVKR